jgi:hypothetical protein
MANIFINYWFAFVSNAVLLHRQYEIIRNPSLKFNLHLCESGRDRFRPISGFCEISHVNNLEISHDFVFMHTDWSQLIETKVMTSLHGSGQDCHGKGLGPSNSTSSKFPCVRKCIMLCIRAHFSETRAIQAVRGLTAVLFWFLETSVSWEPHLDPKKRDVAKFYIMRYLTLRVNFMHTGHCDVEKPIRLLIKNMYWKECV